MPSSSASGSADSIRSASGTWAIRSVAMPRACQTVGQDVSVTRPLLDPAGIEALRAALVAANYTGPGIADRLGNAAVQAIHRGDYRPALRATAGRDPLDTLIRLFVCGQTESESVVRAALPVEAVLLERDGGGVRAAVELEPYADWWVISDLSAT